MAEALSLLAPGATPWMKAGEAADAPAWDVPVNLIPDFADPWRCPAHMLYALALENSGDLWSEDWSEAKKRSVIARSVELHRLKGTQAGIDAYVEIAGGQVKRAISPPQGVFAGGQDEAQRLAWLSRFPEFRLYTHAPWGNDLEDAYAAEAFAGGDQDDGFFPPVAPDVRLQTRAGVLIQDGVEYAMSRREDVALVDGVEHLVEIFTPTATDLKSAYADQAWPDDFLEVTAALPALTISQDLALLDTPGGAARTFRGPFLDSRPERIGDTGEDLAGAYSDVTFLDAAFLEHGLDPAVLSYDRWRLADPQRSAGAVAPDDCFFGDDTYLGLPPFTLLLDIQIDETAPATTVFAGGFESDFPDQTDTSRADLVLEAVRSAAADRDQVLVRFARHRPLRLGDRPTLPFRLGQLVTDF